MSHEELVKLTQNATFELAKDFILEGLSYRLNSFENAIKTETKINVEPRTHFQESKPVAAQDTSVPSLNQTQQVNQQSALFGAVQNL